MSRDLAAGSPPAEPKAHTGHTRHMAILLYPQVEVLDFAGPYEVLTCASRLALRDAPSAPPPFAVHTVAQQAGPVRARAGLQAIADAGWDGQPADRPAPPIHWLIVPGGVVDAERQNAALLAWLHRTAEQADGVASVCTGTFLLAQAGLLPDGTAVTTHWEDAADLQREWPALQVQSERRVIDRGNRITSAGISAGMDMALHLVERLCGRALAERTARQMDVVWTRTDTRA